MKKRRRDGKHRQGRRKGEHGKRRKVMRTKNNRRMREEGRRKKQTEKVKIEEERNAKGKNYVGGGEEWKCKEEKKRNDKYDEVKITKRR